MNRSRLSAPALAIGAALLASGLTGCSADQTSGESPSSSRMVRPSEIPDVSVSSSDDAFTAGGAGATTQYVNVPQQIWVRSASYAHRTYTLTLATAPSGRFNVFDAQAVGGMTLKGLEGGSCTTVDEKPLASPITGAIKQVSRLVTLACPSSSPFTMPVIQGQWDDGSKGGSARAIFAIGDVGRQGRPLDPNAPQGDPAPGLEFDTTVASVKRSGTTIVTRAWATQFAGLSLQDSEAGDRYARPDPECRTTVLTGSKPGVHNRTPQRLFQMTCSHVDPKRHYLLLSGASSGRVGEEPSSTDVGIELVPGATASS